MILRRHMLIQQAMIERLRHICQQDQRLVAAMLYGSFTYGEGDQYSDIDCSLFFQDDALAEVDQIAWISQIAPVELYFFDAKTFRVLQTLKVST
jgi:lincosamide nucleotidyltransferase